LEKLRAQQKPKSLQPDAFLELQISQNSFVEGIGKKNVKGWEGRVRSREEGSGRRRQGRMTKMGKVDPSNSWRICLC